MPLPRLLLVLFLFALCFPLSEAAGAPRPLSLAPADPSISFSPGWQTAPSTAVPGGQLAFTDVLGATMSVVLPGASCRHPRTPFVPLTLTPTSPQSEQRAWITLVSWAPQAVALSSASTATPQGTAAAPSSSSTPSSPESPRASSRSASLSFIYVTISYFDLIDPPS